MKWLDKLEGVSTPAGPGTMKFAGLFAGNLVFFFLFAFMLWMLNTFEITPYGKFMAEFFKGKTPDETKAYIEANREAFERGLPAASRFSNLYIVPVVSFVMGFVAGLFIRERPALWAGLCALPVAGLLWARSSGDPLRVFYILLLLGFAMLGGVVAGKMVKTPEAKPVEHETP